MEHIIKNWLISGFVVIAGLAPLSHANEVDDLSDEGMIGQVLPDEEWADDEWQEETWSEDESSMQFNGFIIL